METDYSVSFPIFQANSLATKEYVKELTPQEKKQQKFKEKRLKDWNKNRVKREFVPKIRPHKPLWPVCYQISFHCAFCLEGNLGAIRSENRKVVCLGSYKMVFLCFAIERIDTFFFVICGISWKQHRENVICIV